MRDRILVALAALWLATLAFAATPAAGRPQPPPESRAIHQFCIAYGGLGTSFADISHPGTKWDCDVRDPSIVPERAFLKFDIPADKPIPRYFTTRRGALDAIHIMALDRDGTTRLRNYTLDTAEPAFLDAFFKVRLPELTRDTKTVFVAIDKPTLLMSLTRAHLGAGDPGLAPENIGLLLLLAAICGMMTMPLIFNIAYYRVLREKFVLWHSSLVFFLFLTLLLHSGLWATFMPLNVQQVSTLSTIVLGLSTASIGMFAYHFIEPGLMQPLLRRSLPWVSAWSVLNSVTHALFPFVARPIQTDLYFAAYVPVLAVHIAMLTSAMLRGSRAAMFQSIGWAALLMVGIARLLGQLTSILEPTDAMPLFYVGVLVEALATALGVADRFLAIKDQRDRAKTEAQMLERLSERDALTGLLNRRALEFRFSPLRAEGFTTLALLDLDRFKSINDEYGHGIGDDVLKAAAAALAPDGKAQAFRLGGEEFVLLMAGNDTFGEAERRRIAISTAVARQVPGLSRMVTASMGLVDLPLDAVPNVAFADIYHRADKLLYEAKQAGRNRTLSERVKLFVPRRKDRRQAAA